MEKKPWLEIPGFSLRKPIAEGGMGVIYVAVDVANNRPVVLKVLDTKGIGGNRMVQRFLQEGRIISGLHHPNIIRLYQVGTAENYLYMAMEYLPGGDLSQKLIRKQCYSQRRTLKLLIEMALALRYAHSKRVLHRDIKPANILFRADRTAVLTDFGIAKLLDRDSELTLPGYAIGSPHYFSPEQARGEALDERSDIYSLGIIAYEMLNGRRPYEGEHFAEIARQHLHEPIPPLPDSLANFQVLLNLMLAKSREDRFRDVNSLIRYLKIIKPKIIREARLRKAMETGVPLAGIIPEPAVTMLQEVEEPPSSRVKYLLGIGIGMVVIVLVGFLIFL